MSTAFLLIIGLAVPAATTQAQTVNQVSAQQSQPAVFTPEEAFAAYMDPDAFTVDPASIRIERIKEEEPAQTQAVRGPKAPEEDADPFVIIDQIINIGQKIWSIIEANRPVVNVTTTYAAAVPQGISHWDQLAGWKEPKGKVYGFYAKNLYGIEVISVKYQVSMTYGGNYKGKGKYLTGVTVVPLMVDVAWGYKFNMDASVPSVSNVGTSEDPVAALIANLHWQISTTMKDSQGTSVYYMQGTGAFKEIGGPFKQAFKEDAKKATEKLISPDFTGSKPIAPAGPVFVGR
ncbi:MAG: hypothetical protein HY922_07480 [Elusimicrobia bacterium]|nr:hypothetical protein [Elusimicrobiota bacterium]